MACTFECEHCYDIHLGVCKFACNYSGAVAAEGSAIWEMYE